MDVLIALRIIRRERIEVVVFDDLQTSHRGLPRTDYRLGDFVNDLINELAESSKTLITCHNLPDLGVVLLELLFGVAHHFDELVVSSAFRNFSELSEPEGL